MLLAKACLQTTAFIIGAHGWGLVGALVGQGVALALSHPLVIWLARRHHVWDARHDLAGGTFAALAIALALWLNSTAIAALP